MDLTNYTLNKQSTIDSQLSKSVSQSTVDYHTARLRAKLDDPALGERMVALALLKLGEAQMDSVTDYVLRRSDNPGKAFVGLCNKLIKEK